MIDKFTDTYGFLSNFYVERDGKTLEHRYQAAKTVSQKDYDTIMHAPTPGKAKRLGRTVALRNDWEEMKIGLMTSLVMTKFLSDRDLAMKLISTGDQALSEGNTWHDNFWGACSCEKCKDKQKFDMLGAILMKVRSKLQKMYKTDQDVSKL